ncbi:MAG: leucine-rich repeat protein [Bacilli bacterium]|nr:leucine-rich repeat protein [Bacilli bacterium]
MELLSFSKYVAKKRVLLGKSQKQLAETLSYTPQAVSRFESLNSAFPIELLNSLCQFLECGLEDIYHRNLEPSSFKKIAIDWDGLPKELAKARKSTPLTQEAFAEALGISSRVIRNYESGATTPSYQLLERWAKLANLSPMALLEKPKQEIQKPINAPLPFYKKRPILTFLIAVLLIAIPTASISIPLAIRRQADSPTSSEVPSLSLESSETTFSDDTPSTTQESKPAEESASESSIVSSSVDENAPTEDEYTPGVLIENGEVTGYIGSSPHLIIPGHWNGYAVTSIREGAFWNNSVMEEVTIPNTFNKIPTEAFSGAGELKKANLPNTITKIEGGAFRGCWKLSRLDLPEHVTSLGIEAFAGSGIQELYLPATCTSLVWESFQDMNSLESIEVEEGNPYFSSFDRALYVRNQSEMIFCPAKVEGLLTLPKNLKTIHRDLLGLAYSVTGFQVEEGSEYLSAFDTLLYNKEQTELLYCPGQCKSNIMIPKTAKTVDFSLFYNCVNLTEVSVEEGNPYFAFIDGVVYDKGVTRMQYCPQHLGKALNIPETVTFLPYSSLQGADITAFNVEEGNLHYASIDGVLFNKKKTTLLAYPFLRNDSFYQVPEGTETIQNGTFYFHKSLEGVAFPDSLKTIKYGAFEETNLSHVEFGSGLETIEGYAFAFTKLEEVEIPNGVKKIKSGAFSNCSSLVSCSLPDSVEELGDSVFAEDESLRNVSVPPKATNIGDGCFRRCAVSFIDIPEGVTEIRVESFAYCQNLKEVVLPASLQYIRDAAFAECNNLQAFYYRGTEEQFSHINIPEGQKSLLSNPFFYSETEPSDSGNYWHYVDGKPVAW